MGYKRFETDQRVIVSVADLLQDRLENITYKPGHGSGLLHLMEVLPGVQHCVVSITRAHNYGRYCRACSILRSKCKVYVLRRLQTCITRNYIGKGIKENMKIPLVDFKVTNYRMPIILLTRDIKLQLCVSALFSLLILYVNR
jgi:hypothetical protein